MCVKASEKVSEKSDDNIIEEVMAHTRRVVGGGVLG